MNKAATFALLVLLATTPASAERGHGTSPMTCTENTCTLPAPADQLDAVLLERTPVCSSDTTVDLGVWFGVLVNQETGSEVMSPEREPYYSRQSCEETERRIAQALHLKSRGKTRYAVRCDRVKYDPPILPPKEHHP